MKQTQLNWMQDNGYDPEQYDMDLNGNVLKRQAAVAEEDQTQRKCFGQRYHVPRHRQCGRPMDQGGLLRRDRNP